MEKLRLSNAIKELEKQFRKDNDELRKENWFEFIKQRAAFINENFERLKNETKEGS
tara:strand:- start:324 stop:491 length:168 start_codon:yes stop_codon:yes gene_type:complete